MVLLYPVAALSDGGSVPDAALVVKNLLLLLLLSTLGNQGRIDCGQACHPSARPQGHPSTGRNLETCLFE